MLKTMLLAVISLVPRSEPKLSMVKPGVFVLSNPLNYTAKVEVSCEINNEPFYRVLAPHTKETLIITQPSGDPVVFCYLASYTKADR